MTHLIDKHLIERAHTARLLGILWAALGHLCARGAGVRIRLLVRSLVRRGTWRQDRSAGSNNP